MLEQSQKLTDGLIIYSVLVSDYEKLDFKNDALAGVRGVECVDGLLAQHFRQVFQGSRFRTAQKYLAVHVAHNGVCVVLVDGFQLASRLQNKAGGDLTAADGRHQFFQIGNLPDVGTLVDQAPHMDGQLAAVHIICFIAQQIEKLGVDHD